MVIFRMLARVSVGIALLAARPALAHVAPADSQEPAAAQSPRRGLEDLDLGSLLDTPLDVWTASRSEESIKDAPAIIRTVTREQIAVWGHRTLAEVLSHMLGFFPVDDHVLPNLAVRGVSGGLHADSSVVKIMIDGHSVAFHSTGGNWLGPELIPLTAVERIEVVRGPASALFGADAFLGVINIKTRAGRSLHGANAWMGAGQTGQHLATDVDAVGGGAAGPFDFLLALRYNVQDLSGLRLPDSSPAPSIPSYAGDSRQAHGLVQRSTSLFGRAGYQSGAGTTLRAFGYFSALRRGDEFGALYQLAYGTNQQNIFSENLISLWQARAGVLWEQALGRSSTLSARATLFRGAPGRDDREEVGSDFYYVRPSFGFRGGDIDTQLEWHPPWQALRGARVVVGASAFLDDEELPSRIAVAKQPTVSAQPGEVLESLSIRQGDHTFLNVGSYLQATLQLVPRFLTVNAGIRHDWHNQYGGQLSERLGLVSSPARWLNIKLLYGTAFKAPSPTLLYAVPAAIGDVSGNPYLRPQYARTVELLVAWEPIRAFNLSSSLVFNQIGDKTEFVQQGINRVAENVARATTIASESKAELKLGSRLHAYLSAELQRTIRRSGQEGYSADIVGTQAGIYPNLLLRGGGVIQLPRLPVRASVEAIFVGPRRPSDTNIVLNGGSYTLPAYTLLDAGLSTAALRPFGRRQIDLSFALLGKNLLGETGPAPGFSGVEYPLAPRSIFLQAMLSF